ncbi:HIT family protein [Candidatus Pacearchaeota archaeon]|nr:HIT family protein [Candidatus Pacearchaeota archaeon]
MDDECLICDRISMIKKRANPYFVKELETGYVVIGDFQFYRGYTLLLYKEHVSELHELPNDFRQKFLEEMSLVGKAVHNTFHPEKLNYELLGNLDRHHCHWHIFPRYNKDPEPTRPIWVIDQNIRCGKNTRPKKEELKKLKIELKKELDILF